MSGYLARLGDSCAGVAFGVLLVLVSFPVLVTNEGRSVRRYRALAEGRKVVVPALAASMDPSNEGRLVHLSGETRAGSAVSDPSFGVGPLDGTVKLRRNVEMYQWVENRRTETKHKSDGTKYKETYYEYSRNWKSDVVNSDRFREGGHENPGYMPFPDFQSIADPVWLGAYHLPNTMVDMLNWYQDLPVSQLSVKNITVSAPGPAQLTHQGLYFGSNPQYPQIGDTRVSFDVVKEGPISVLAKQVGGGLDTYGTKNGGSIFILKQGTISAMVMFDQAVSENKAITWLLRFVGFALMGFGFHLITKPLEVATDIIPIVGCLVERGLDMLAFILAFLLSSIVIAISWLAYRPLICVPVLVVAGGINFWLWKRVQDDKKASYDEINQAPVVQAEIIAEPVGVSYDDDVVVKPLP